MKLLRTVGLVWFLGWVGVGGYAPLMADAKQPPRFTLTDLGSVDGQANPYTSPTGYTMQAVYSTDLYKPGYRIGWTFTKDGSKTNLLPDNMANDVNIPGYNLVGYSTSGIVFGDDLNTGSSFYLNTNTNEYGNFKNSGLHQLGISSVNSFGQGLGSAYLYFSDNTSLLQATFYSSLLSDPVILKDLLVYSSSDWVLLSGAGINDSGQIFGTMFNTTTRQSDYYRLDPIVVPEPSTFVVIAAGVLLLIARNKHVEKR